MISNKRKITVYLSTAIVVFLLFSCKDNFKEVQKSTFAEFTPSGEADSINIKYTDSGITKNDEKNSKPKSSCESELV